MEGNVWLSLNLVRRYSDFHIMFRTQRREGDILCLAGKVFVGMQEISKLPSSNLQWSPFLCPQESFL